MKARINIEFIKAKLPTGKEVDMLQIDKFSNFEKTMIKAQMNIFLSMFAKELEKSLEPKGLFIKASHEVDI
jgi:hypothetical protein